MSTGVRPNSSFQYLNLPKIKSETGNIVFVMKFWNKSEFVALQIKDS